MSYQEIASHVANLPVSEIAQPYELQETEVWGFWSTLGLSFLIIAADFATSIAFYFWIGGHSYASISGMAVVHLWGFKLGEGDVDCLATLVSALTMVPLTLLAVFWRRTRNPWAYLRLRLPTWRQTWVWLLIIVGADLALGALATFLGWTQGWEVMIEFFGSSRHEWLLFAAIVLFAPLNEEFLFRGFMLPGLSRSPMGNTGGVLLTSILWSLLHFQYDWFGMLNILAAGFLLGSCVLRTKSLPLAVGLHAVVNAISFAVATVAI